MPGLLCIQLATSHNPLTYNESVGFSALIFVTAGVFLVWLAIAKSRELVAERVLADRAERRRKKLVEMSYEQVALAAIDPDDILLVRLQDGTLARVYAPGLGIKAAEKQERERGAEHKAAMGAADTSYQDAMNSMMGGAGKSGSSRQLYLEDAAIVVAPPIKPVEPAPVETAPAPSTTSAGIELQPLVCGARGALYISFFRW